jgi:predicted nucleotidyltransferase
VNRGSILLDELRQIFLKTDYLGEAIRKELEGRVRFAFIYGSFAEGEETEGSDIDLFVIGDMKEDDLLRIIQKLEKATGREINYVLWNEKTFMQRAKGHHLLKAIKESRIVMLVGDESAFRKAIR